MEKIVERGKVHPYARGLSHVLAVRDWNRSPESLGYGLDWDAA
jgi:hypothetical protein